MTVPSSRSGADPDLRSGVRPASGEAARIAAIGDPFLRLAAVTRRLAESGQEVAELSQLRRGLVHDLHSRGFSHAEIAAAAGLSRGRIHQILHC